MLSFDPDFFGVFGVNYEEPMQSRIVRHMLAS